MAAIQLASRKHPLYEENVSNWEFYFDAVKGGKNILTDQYLHSHRLEDTEDYDERLERGYYLNFCEAIPSIYNSYIFRERIERPPDENLAYFRLNTDGRRTNISDFVKRAGFYSSIYGVIHALVDVPIIKKTSISKRDVKQGVSPFATLVYPSQLVDWSVDPWGNWRWVVIAYTYYRDDDPNKEREEETHYKLITTKDWRVEDENGQKVSYPDTDSSGKNTLGIIPLVSMYSKDTDDDKIGESLIKDIAYVNKAILNWCSCIDEQIERQTFSQLVVPDDGTMHEENQTGDDPIRKISVSSVWTFPSDSGQPPQFISPNVENISTIWKIAQDHIKEIYRLAGLLGGTGDLYTSVSGKASQIGFQGVNSALAEKAAIYQKFENELNRFAYIQQNKNPEEMELVKYPTSFDVASLSEEIDAMFRVMDGRFSKTLNKTIQKNMARRATPMASQNIRKMIEDEIESNDGEFNSTTSNFNQPNDGGEVGNTNVDRVSDTFRTKKDQEFDEKTKKKKEE